MNLIALITGGAASGKSEIAERLAVTINNGKMAYLATMHVYDDECRKRIEKHRKMRKGKGFETFEVPYHLAGCKEQLTGYDTVLLECMSNLIANEMYIAGRNRKETIQVINTDIQELGKSVNNIIIVSSTVFSGIHNYDEFTADYIKVIGQINCDMAAVANILIEAVCSIPVIYKGKKEISEVENLR